MTNATVSKARNAKLHEVQAEQARTDRRRLIRSLILWAAGLAAVAAIIGVAMANSAPSEGGQSKPAAPFTLTDTAGKTQSLADYRGHNVLLYFNEGAGCGSCLVQMAQIEKQAAAFKAADITVLPIVMNTRDQILPDMAANKVATPFLLDDGTVSSAYGTLGKGMHEGLPGHSFVLIDATGTQRWYGEYPSMWMDPTQLLAKATSILAS